MIESAERKGQSAERKKTNAGMFSSRQAQWGMGNGECGIRKNQSTINNNQ